jgi:hypothetical protein
MGMEPAVFSVSEAGLAAWIESVAAYASQISSFWFSQENMETDIRGYCQNNGGVQLWRYPEQTFD